VKRDQTLTRLEAKASSILTVKDLANRGLRETDLFGNLPLSQALLQKVGDEGFPVHGSIIRLLMEQVNSNLIEFSNTLPRMDTFGSRVKEARAKAKLSQEALARKVGVSQGLIGQIEKGINGGSQHIASLARHLGVSADWLESGKGPKQRVGKNIIAVASGMEDRLAHVIGIAGGDDPFIEKTGITKDRLAALKSSEETLTLDEAARIQVATAINLVWLLQGKGAASVEPMHSDEYRPIPIPAESWKGVPVVGMASLGDNGFWADVEYPVGHGDGFVDVPTKDKDAYALRCIGDSMRPRIKDREFVVIEPNHEIEPGDEVLVKAKDGRVMVKEFMYQRAGRVHLLSVNETHGKLAFALDEIDKMHYVGWIAKPSAWRPA